jgi:hypothetical protein
MEGLKLILVKMKLISLSFFDGVWDSLRNIFVIFYLDTEMNKKLAAKKVIQSKTDTAEEKTKKSNKERKKE